MVSIMLWGCYIIDYVSCSAKKKKKKTVDHLSHKIAVGFEVHSLLTILIITEYWICIPSQMFWGTKRVFNCIFLQPLLQYGNKWKWFMLLNHRNARRGSFSKPHFGRVLAEEPNSMIWTKKLFFVILVRKHYRLPRKIFSSKILS